MTDTNDDARRPAGETPARAQEPAQTPDGERIAKAIARAGIASRRDAEAMILAGRVTLNGVRLDSPAQNVTDEDRITVDGEPLPARERTRLWILHKERGVVTTARDPEGRPTVFDGLPDDLPRVVAIGRLDINTEGLLLLTNDGGLAKVVAHPDTGWLRRYRVRAYGETDQAALDALRNGVTIDEMEYGPIEATLDRVQGDNLWLTLGLREGKNREVKRILEHLGLRVNRLIRLSFGPFQLGDLEPGLVEEVRTRVLKDQLGKSLAEQAEVDFESPVREPIAPFGAPAKAARAPAGGGASRPARPSSRFDGGSRGDAPRGRPREGGFREGGFGARGDATGRGGARGADRGAAPRSDERGPRVPARLAGPKRSVWRADEAGEEAGRRAPRRGGDARAERAAAGERPRARVGTVGSGERRVLVERVMADPAADPPQREREAARGRPRRFDDAPGARGTGQGRPPRREGEASREGGSGRGGDFGGTGRPPRAGAPGERPRGGGSFGDKPFGAKPFGAKRFDGKPAGDRFAGGRGEGDRPGGFKAGGRGGPRPGGARFESRGDGERGGPRPDGPRGGAPGRGAPGRGFGRGGAPGGKPFGGKPGGGFSGGKFSGGKPPGGKPPRRGPPGR